MAGRQIGALWTGKEGSKAVLGGTIEFLGEPIRISVFKNDKKEPGSSVPDYRIVRFIDDAQPNGQSQEPPQGESLPF